MRIGNVTHLAIEVKQISLSRAGEGVQSEQKELKGLPPGRILYSKIPLVFRNGPTSNHELVRY